MFTTHTTAAQAYRHRQRDVSAMLAQIQELVNQQARMASRDPQNWAYVGDIGFVSSRLEDIHRFLGCRT